MILRLADSVKCRQGICFHRLVSFQVLGKKLANGSFRNTIDSLHGNETGTFLTGFPSNKNGPFSLSSPASFASAFSTNNGVVKLDQIFKPIDAVPVSHSFSDLVAVEKAWSMSGN
jgi:hypothetical protein